MKRFIFSILMLLMMTTHSFAQSSAHVVFLHPDVRTHDFFGPFTTFMEFAADSLNIDLEVIEVGQSQYREAFRKGKEVLDREKLPDYLIVIEDRNIAADLIEYAKGKEVHTFLVNERLVPEKYEEIGHPREKIDNWVGELMADEDQAGYLLAKELLDRADEQGLRGKDGKIHIAAINGDQQSYSAQHRLMGLEAAVSERSDVILHQVVYAQWERANAKRQAAGLLKRYPEISVFWAASDLMADGAISAALDHGKVPGYDILFGGIDWADIGIENVEKGWAVGSVGGHVYDGGWSLVMLYDHFQGRDLKGINKSRFSLLTKENMHLYRKHLRLLKGVHKLDFKKFSKTQTSADHSYDFSLKKIFEILENQ